MQNEVRSTVSRRQFLRLSAVTLGGALLAACTPTQPAPSQAPAPAQASSTQAPAPAQGGAKQKVLVWSFPRTTDDIKTIFGPLNDKFKAVAPEIEMSVEILPWSGRREKMLTAYAGGQNPDVAMMQNDMLSLMNLNGVLAPLGDVIAPERLEEVPERAKAGISWKGALVMMPFAFSMDTNLWNKGLAKEVGWTKDAPQSWDDIRQLGPLCEAKNIYAWEHKNSSWSRWVELTWQAGGTVYNEDITKALVADAAGMEVMSFVVEMFKNGWIPKEGNVGSEEEDKNLALNYFFTNKQVISGGDDLQIINTVKDEAKDMEWGMVPPMKNKDYGVLASIDTWGLFKNSKSKEGAGKWIAFMVEPENEGHFSSQSGIAPASDTALEFWEVDPELKALAELYLPKARSNQDTSWYWQEGKTALMPEVQAAVLDMKTVEQACKDVQAKLQALIDRDMPKRE